MYGIEQEIQVLQNDIDLLIEKHSALSQASITSIDPGMKFNLEHQVENITKDIDKKRARIHELNKIVSGNTVDKTKTKALRFTRPEFHIPRQIIKNSGPRVRSEQGYCDFEKEFQSQSLIVLLGEAGIGKTIELQWICHELQEKTSYIPVFKSLKGQSDLPVTDRELEEQIVLVLDGLDESTSIELMKASIQDFISRHSNVKILVSCRKTAYSNTLDGFEQYELGPLRQEDIQQFVEEKLGTALGREFLSDWYGRHPWKPTQLIENPFYLYHICVYIQDKKNTLPQSSEEVFEYLIDRSLDMRLKNISRYGDGNFQHLRATCRESLEKLAFVMECRAGNTVADAELRQIIQAKEEIDIILGKSSLMELHDDNSWHFVHNNFQEYLAAVALSQAASLDAIQKAIAAGPDFKRLRWSWINTLFYLFEIWKDSNPMKDALIEWLKESDIEALVKIGSFDTDKISESTRLKIFKEIFEASKEDGVIIGFSHYSWRELAELGESAEAFRYLMNELRVAKVPIARGNALLLLSYMKPYFLPHSIRSELQMELSRQIFEVTDNRGPERHYAIQALLHLYLKDLPKEEAVAIVNRFFDADDAWERTAACHVIERKKLQSDFVVPLVTRSKQMEDSEWQKGEVKMADEDWEVKKCFEGIEDEDTLILFFEQYIDMQDEERWYRSNEHLNILIKKLPHIAFTTNGVNQLFQVIKTQITEWISYTSAIDKTAINEFINSYNLRFELYRFCVEDKAISDTASLACASLYLNEEGIELLVKKFQTGHIQRSDIDIFLKWVANNNEIYLSPLIQQLNIPAEYPFETPLVPRPKDHALIERKKVAVEKSLLFNKEKFIVTVEAIFAELGKDIIEKKGAKKYKRDIDIHEQYPRLVIEFVNWHHSKEKSEVLRIIDLHWDEIFIYHVKRYLESNKEYIKKNPELGLDPENLKNIRSWCDSHQMEMKPQETSTDGDMLFFWFVIYCKLDYYPKKIYYRMIESNIQSNLEPAQNIELLPFLLESQILSIQQIKDTLIDALQSDSLYGHTIYKYFKFIKSQNIQEAISILPRFMEDKVRGNDLRNYAIQTYIDLGGDDQYLLELLKRIVRENNDIREELILSHFSRKQNKDFEHFALQKIYHDSDPVTQLMYAKTLFNIGNLAGLKYITDYMMREKKSPFHLSENFALRFENPEGIPILLKLFDIDADDNIEPDFYYSIRAAARSALVHLATCRGFKYFNQVREAILEGGYIVNPSAQIQVKYIFKDIEFKYYQREVVSYEKALEKWAQLSA